MARKAEPSGTSEPARSNQRTSSKFPSIFLACGEPFLTENRWNSFLSELRTEKGEASISTQVFHVSDADLDSILAQARGLSFLSTFQAFRIKESDKLKKIDNLERYLEKPFEGTFLYFEAPALAKDHPLVKLISQKGQVQYFESAQENKAGGLAFVKQKLKNAGKTLGPGASERLEQMAEISPSFMDSFLEKLISYSGDAVEITEQTVELFHEKMENTDTFQLTNALFSAKAGEALIILKKLLREDEKDLIPLLGFLHWQIRRIWVARVLFEEGVPESEILRRSKVYSKQAPFFVRQFKQFKRDRLEKSLEGLFQLDWKIKTGQVDGSLGAEVWILEFQKGLALAGKY